MLDDIGPEPVKPPLGWELFSYLMLHRHLVAIHRPAGPEKDDLMVRMLDAMCRSAQDEHPRLQ
jgi:hypothetical protein